MTKILPESKKDLSRSIVYKNIHPTSDEAGFDGKIPNVLL